ncbi:MAG: ATP-binding cassette domain-containing protein [Verrucomicrobiota bacterium]
MGFKDADFERKAKEMSGGWVMRARLARLLVMEPDLLLLDEPTNHLDLMSLLWLQNYLKNYSGAVLLISHDRQFMDEIIGQVHEIADKKLIAYTGNYTDYLRQREERYEQQLAAYKNQQKEIAALQEFVIAVSLRDLEGVAGDEQAQADRAHGTDRAAASAAQTVPLSHSAAATWRTAGGNVGGGSHGLRHTSSVSRPRPHD